MKNQLLFIFFMVCFFSYSQKANLGQYYSFCENSSVKEKEEKIEKVYRVENKWIIKAKIKDNCLVRLYPNFEVFSDTLKIDLLEITEYEIELENGDRFVEELPEYDCSCLHDVKMEFSLDKIKHLIINDKLIRKNAFLEN